VVIRGASSPEWRGIPAHDSVTAQLEFNGKGGVHRYGGSPIWTFTLDTGAEPSTLCEHAVRELGIRANDAKVQTDTVAGGGQMRVGVVPVLLYLMHRRPWYYWPLDIQDYSVFLVDFHIPAEVFTDPNGEGQGAENLLGMDVLQVLRHAGQERMSKAAKGRGLKWLTWDLKPNLQIRFGKRLELRNYPYDVRPWESQYQSIVAQLHETRRQLGIESETSSGSAPPKS